MTYQLFSIIQCQILFYIYIYIYHHHHHVVPPAGISSTLSRHFFLSFNASGWSSGLYLVSLHSCCMYVRAGRTRHAGHCWRSRDELISDVLLWTPTHGRAKAGRPARTYIQQLCEDTGCCPEDLPEAMNDREKWRERVRDIHTSSTT